MTCSTRPSSPLAAGAELTVLQGTDLPRRPGGAAEPLPGRGLWHGVPGRGQQRRDTSWALQTARGGQRGPAPGNACWHRAPPPPRRQERRQPGTSPSSAAPAPQSQHRPQPGPRGGTALGQMPSSSYPRPWCPLSPADLPRAKSLPGGSYLGEAAAARPRRGPGAGGCSGGGEPEAASMALSAVLNPPERLWPRC